MFDRMKMAGTRLLYSAAYMLALIVCCALGRGLARFAGVTSNGGSVSFLAVFIGAALVMWAGIIVEDRLLWARVPGRDAEMPAFIGRSRGNFLTSAAPPPVALGLALGMVSALLA